MVRALSWSLLAVAAVFLLVAYGSDLFAERGVQVSHWGDGTVRSRSEALRYPDGRYVLDGSYLAYHPDGTKYLQGAYREGKADGLWSEWDDQGVLRKRGNYRHGQPDGRWEYWNPGADPEHEVLEWRDGRVIENGEAVSPPPAGPPDFFGWRGQLAGYLKMLLLLLGPLPMAVLAAGTRPGVESDSSPERAGAAEHWLVALTAWCLIQLGIALVLSSTGWLRAGPLFAVEALILLAGVSLARRRGIEPRAFAPRVEHPAALALFAAFVTLGLAALEKGLAVPMTDWDGLAYHLPLMAEWIQHGSLVTLPELGQTGLYPSHWELGSLIGYFAFGEDLLFTLPDLVAWAILALSVQVLARRAGARATDATATALLLCSLPVVLMQTEEMKADLPLAAAFGASLVLGGFLHPERRASRPALFFLGLGWLCGLKSSGPVYALVAVVVVLVWWVAVAEGPRRPRAAVLKTALPAALAALGLAVFWYLRNYLELGNPLGQVQVQVLGKEIFAGEMTRAELQRTSFSALWRPTDAADAKALLAAGREWIGWTILPLVIAYLAALVRGWGTRRARWTTALLLVLVVVCGALYAITPFSGDNGSHGWRISSWVGQTWRYALPKFLAASVLAALGWKVLRLRSAIPAVLAVFAAAWAAALHAAPPRPSLLAGLGVAILAALLLSPLRRRLAESRVASRLVPPAGSSRRAAIALLVLAAVAVDMSWLHSLREQRERGRHELYDLPYSYALEAKNEVPLGFAMTQLRYPLYGRDLRQRVMDVSCRGCARSSWFREILDSGMEVLALGPRPVHRSFARPETDLRPWVEDDGAPFEPLQRVGSGAGEGIVLYRVLR